MIASCWPRKLVFLKTWVLAKWICLRTWERLLFGDLPSPSSWSSGRSSTSPQDRLRERKAVMVPALEEEDDEEGLGRFEAAATGLEGAEGGQGLEELAFVADDAPPPRTKSSEGRPPPSLCISPGVCSGNQEHRRVRREVRALSRLLFRS